MRYSSKQAICGLAVVAGGVALLRYAMRSCEYSFRDKVVLITGGARGLGLVMARRLAAEGAKLVLCSRTAEQLERAQAELQSRGAQVLTFRCDVTRRSEVEAMVRQVIDTWSTIDVLINNAGVIQVGPLEAMRAEDYQQALETHFWGPFNTINAVLPQMRERGEGRIVNISSIGGRISIPHLLPYSVSKFALVGYSEGLRSELSKHGIWVTTVSPGLMRTGSPRNALFKGRHRSEYTWFTLGGALPPASMNADRAAAQTIEACRRGASAITLSLPAKAAHALHGLFPGATADVAGLVNRLLPKPGGIGQRSARGYDSQSLLAPSVLTTLNEQAAAANNEL